MSTHNTIQSIEIYGRTGKVSVWRGSAVNFYNTVTGVSRYRLERLTRQYNSEINFFKAAGLIVIIYNVRKEGIK